MACWLDKEHTCVDSVVDNIHAVDLVFCIKIRVKARFNILDNGMPGISVVDKIAKARSIDHGQAKTNTILFDVCAYRFDLDCFWHELIGGSFSLLWGIEGGIEQRIDKS